MHFRLLTGLCFKMNQNKFITQNRNDYYFSAEYEVATHCCALIKCRRLKLSLILLRYSRPTPSTRVCQCPGTTHPYIINIFFCHRSCTFININVHNNTCTLQRSVNQNHRNKQTNKQPGNGNNLMILII